MAPTHKRFRSNNISTEKIDLGLVVLEQFTALDSGSDLFGELHGDHSVANDVEK